MPPGLSRWQAPGLTDVGGSERLGKGESPFEKDSFLPPPLLFPNLLYAQYAQDKGKQKGEVNE